MARAAVVAQWKSMRLVIKQSWVQNLFYVGLFSLLAFFLYLYSCESLKGPSRRCNTTGKGAEQCSMGRTKLIVHLVSYNYKNALKYLKSGPSINIFVHVN